MGSQSDLVTNEIRRLLSEGILRPGDPLDETALKEKFSLSITPIRESLLMLEALGLVERRRRAGAYIRSLDLETLIGLVETDAELEGAAAHFAAQRINPMQTATLEQALFDCEAYAERNDADGDEYYRLNLRFHRAFIDASGNPQLREMIDQVGGRLVFYFRTRHKIHGEIKRSVQQHRAIYEAIVAGDKDLARSLTVQHCTFDRTMPLTVINLAHRPK